MTIIRLLFWAVEIVLILGIFSYCFYITGLFLSRMFEVPFVPTSREAIHKVFVLIKPKQGSKILELGCGDGRVICTVVKRYGLYGHGIDKNLIFIIVSRVRALLLQINRKVSFTCADALRANLGWADIIYLFMIPKFIQGEKMKNKILSEVKSGTYIISHWFEIDYLKIKEIHRVETNSHTTYVYRI